MMIIICYWILTLSLFSYHLHGLPSSSFVTGSLHFRYDLIILIPLHYIHLLMNPYTFIVLCYDLQNCKLSLSKTMISTTSKKNHLAMWISQRDSLFYANLDSPHFGPLKTISLTTRMLRPTQTQTQTQTPTPKDMVCECAIWMIGSVTYDMNVIV